MTGQIIETIQQIFLFLLSELRHSNHRIGAHTCTNHTVPCGTALLGGAFPGTSCQATIASSLRDADPMDGQPGDKSPGYYRASLRDKVKTGFQMSKLQTRRSGTYLFSAGLVARR